MNKAIIQFLGDRGSPNGAPHLAKTVVNGVTDLAAATQLANDLVFYSDAVLYKHSLVEESLETLTPPQTNANIDYRAACIFRNEDTGASIRMELPAYNGTPEEQSEGDRIPTADIVTLGNALNSATNKNVVGSWGYIQQKR